MQVPAKPRFKGDEKGTRFEGWGWALALAASLINLVEGTGDFRA